MRGRRHRTDSAIPSAPRSAVSPHDPPPKPPREGLAALLASAVLVVAVAAAFWPVFSADWVGWDDDWNFTENWDWRGLSGPHLRWMFTTFHLGHYQPLSWLTLALDWSVWGLNARGFHATNVGLHAATAVAAWFLFRRLLVLVSALKGRRPMTPGRAAIGATWAALIFAVHPLRVESVAWITERRDVLSGLFFVLATSAWVRYATAESRRRGAWYAVVFVLTLFSLLSKAWAMTLPAVFLILDVWPLRRFQADGKRVWIEKLPFLALSALFAWLAIRAQATMTGFLTYQEHSLLERAIQIAYGVAFYPLATVWPARLIPVREIPASLVQATYVVPGLCAMALTVGLVWFRCRVPALLAAWIAYVAILSPASGIAQTGPQLVADRYSYLSCLPLALLAGGGLAGWAWRMPIRYVCGMVAWAIVGVFGTATFQQAKVWRNTESLWQHTLRFEPDSSVALKGLGALRLAQYREASDPDARRALLAEARNLFMRDYDKAPSLESDLHLGVIAGEEAEFHPERRDELLRESLIRIERSMAMTRAQGKTRAQWRLFFAVALLRSDRPGDALSELQEVLRVWPDNPYAHRIAALACESLQRWGEAAAYIEHALRYQPEEALLWLRLGVYRSAAGQHQPAVEALHRAMALRQAQRGGTAQADEIVRQAQNELAAIEALNAESPR